MEKWLQIDWTPEAISSYGIIFFIFFGSWALFVQGRKIWVNKSGTSVSGAWTLIFFFMFLTYPIIGVERQNNLILWQGVFRISFYIPILWGLCKFRTWTEGEVRLGKIFFLMIFIMIEYPFSGEFVFSALNFFGVLGVFAQGRCMKEEKESGVVSPFLLFVYAINVVFWLWYTYQMKDFFLFINTALFLAAYMYTITIWAKIRIQELSRVTA